MVLPFLCVTWQGSVAHALGVLAGLLGRRRAAESHFEKALAIGRTLTSPPLVATSRYWYGELLLRLGRAANTRARRAVRGAGVQGIAERTGMRDIARRCADLQRARGPGASRRRRPEDSNRSGGPAGSA